MPDGIKKVYIQWLPKFIYRLSFPVGFEPFIFNFILSSVAFSICSFNVLTA